MWLRNLASGFEYIIRYTNKTERNHFLELEKIHWKG